MAKCGYTVLVCEWNVPHGPVVIRVNGRVARKQRGSDFAGEELHAYLNRAGQDGWRVVGVGGSGAPTVILEKCVDD